jgi:hypothetical protein
MQQRNTAVLASVLGMSVLGALIYFKVFTPSGDDGGQPTAAMAVDRPVATAGQDGVVPGAAQEPRAPVTAGTGERGAEGTTLLDRLESGDADLLEKYGFGERELALASIDLEALKAKMPDNLFWEMSAPTRDELVREQRRETRALWREQKNLISANLADEYAIRDYFVLQNTLSEDYVAVTNELLDNYSNVLPDRDYQLLLMANRLHSARLQEIPGQLATALENRREFLSRRERWREDPAAYEEALRVEREAALQELAARTGAGAPANQ